MVNLLNELRKAKDPKVAIVYLIGLALVIITLWLGIQSLILFGEGNRNPSLPMSTPCPVLSASMLPNQYELQYSGGWHRRQRVQPSVPGVDIVVEHRCFNAGSGSTFLWVNNQLAAFTRGAHKHIFDCHGDVLYYTAYDSYIEKKLKLKVYDASDKYIWASDIPSDSNELLIYGQPEDLVAAVITKYVLAPSLHFAPISLSFRTVSRLSPSPPPCPAGGTSSISPSFPSHSNLRLTPFPSTPPVLQPVQGHHSEPTFTSR
jgi:hypothetical protein